MRPLIQEITTAHTPESLVENLRAEPGIVLLRTSSFDSPQARYSFVAAQPFLTFRSFGSRCEISRPVAVPQGGMNLRTSTTNNSPPFHNGGYVQFGNPWKILDMLLARCEMLDEIDLPFPLGGCFGAWGYDLKNFIEPKLPRRAVNDLELPDCHVGFYDSLVVFDHHLGKRLLSRPASLRTVRAAKSGQKSSLNSGERCCGWKPKVGRAVLCPLLNEGLPTDSAHGVTRPTCNPISRVPNSLRRSNAPGITSRPAIFTR